MFLLKNVTYEYRNDTLSIQDGIDVSLQTSTKKTKKVIVHDPFWGKVKIKFTIFSHLKKKNNYYLLYYANKFTVKDVTDGYKKIQFYIGTYHPDKVEGCIVFIKNRVTDGKLIETSGQKIFGRYPGEGVFVLRKGDFINCFNKTLRVQGEDLIISE